jgi:hypothetical protein
MINSSLFANDLAKFFKPHSPFFHTRERVQLLRSKLVRTRLAFPLLEGEGFSWQGISVRWEVRKPGPY